MERGRGEGEHLDDVGKWWMVELCLHKEKKEEKKRKNVVTHKPYALGYILVLQCQCDFHIC